MGARVVTPLGGRERATRFALWTLFWVLVAAWALLLWHPWIDWFGRR